MPENETILPNSRIASRWRPVGDRMDKGQSRRQAMITAGITEAEDAYTVDLFANPAPSRTIPVKQMQAIKAFHQQVAHLADLDFGRAPPCFNRYLSATHAVSTDEQLV